MARNLIYALIGAISGSLVAGLFRNWLALPPGWAAPFGALVGALVGFNRQQVLDRAKAGLEVGFLGEMMIGGAFGGLLAAIPGFIAGVFGGIATGLIMRSLPTLFFGIVFGVLFSTLPSAAMGALVGAVVAAVLRPLAVLLARRTAAPATG